MGRASTRKTFTVDKSETKKSASAIYLPIKRKDTGNIVDHRWFPLSQLTVDDSGKYVTVTVPNWLYKKEVGNSFTIGS